MEDHLHIKHDIIHQVVHEDFGNRNICISLILSLTDELILPQQ
jgi:hypothetical protein